MGATRLTKSLACCGGTSKSDVWVSLRAVFAKQSPSRDWDAEGGFVAKGTPRNDKTPMLRELALHILDVVENSVNAGATLVTIEVIEEMTADRLTIRVGDNGRGMDAEAVQRAADPFFTTRTTRRVGLGLPFLKQATELSNGSFAIESALGRGTTVTATFQHSHINRMPLGDLSNTILTLVVGYPQTDLVYRHKLDERFFEFDTRPIKAELGDVPLSEPTVIEYLRREIADSLAQIYGL